MLENSYFHGRRGPVDQVLPAPSRKPVDRPSGEMRSDNRLQGESGAPGQRREPINP